MATILSDNSLTLTGDVGDFGFGDCFSHSDVVQALAKIDDGASLTVFLNSGGGYAAEGAAIHALLSRRAGTTDIIVDGIAASAASLIAMAGDTIKMSAGSVMMIHDPATVTVGDAAAHAKSVEGLEALATSYARIYAARSGKSVGQARAIMKAEKWLDPEEAVSEGFADAMHFSAAKPVAAFDYRIYAHAPQRLVALASNHKWKRPSVETAASAAKHRGTSMPAPAGHRAKTNIAILRAAVDALSASNGKSLSPSMNVHDADTAKKPPQKLSLHEVIEAGRRRRSHI